MPELPEVETIARRLRPRLLGATIQDARLRWRRTLATPSASRFRALIRGQEIQEVSRRAKYLVLRLSGYSLLIHLRMSGDLVIRESTIKPEKHDRLILTLAAPLQPMSARDLPAQALIFNDTRKFGRIWLTAQPEAVLGKLGPEPLSRAFTPQWLHDALHSKHRQLKPLLLDQTFLAGLGNIYTDEALHLARLSPLAASDSITPGQADALHQAIRSVLREGIRRNGASFDWVYRGGEYAFQAYDRAGKPCPHCGTPIQRIIVGQRSTYICPHCQIIHSGT